MPNTNPPQLINNRLDIFQGDSKVFTSSDLSATDPDNEDTGLQFNSSQVRRGYFHVTNNPQTKLTQFTQQDIQQGQVTFTHDDSDIPPSYAVSVSDGLLSFPQTGTGSRPVFIPEINPEQIILAAKKIAEAIQQMMT